MFTKDELKSLDKLIDSLYQLSSHESGTSFKRFMGEWFDFIRKVEEGYTMTIDDYTNDLSLRERLEEVKAKAPKDVKHKLDELIEKWDKRFEDITTKLVNPLSRREYPSWWWFRIPKKLVGDLKDDVESLKIK